MKRDYTITEHYNYYNFENLKFDSDKNTDFSIGFVFKCRLDEKIKTKPLTVLYEMPGIIKISAGFIEIPENTEELDRRAKTDLCDIYKNSDGTSPVIKAEVFLKQSYGETKVLSLYLPLNRFALKDEFYLYFDGSAFMYIVDGETVNMDYTIGEPVHTDGDVYINNEYFECSASDQIGKAEITDRTEIKHQSISFYSGRGYNEWIGDCMNFYHDGVYHFLFLADRHHHSGRFGVGAHRVDHMTTRDFINWEHHGTLVPLDEGWKTCGTGTMLYFDGKYYFSFGYHTDRTVPREKCGNALLDENYNKNGYYSAVSYEELKEKGFTPSGTNYFVSSDGIHFVSGDKQICSSENPSMYSEDGKLLLYCGYGVNGLWQADNIDGPWTPSNINVPTWHTSKAKNSTECPSMFTLDGTRYVLLGFDGCWRQNPDGSWYDFTEKGEDIYDGLGVPMVTVCENRAILTGWTPGYGWAFLSAHREVFKKSDGRLGTRWLPELTPDAEELDNIYNEPMVTSGSTYNIKSDRSYYIECDVAVKNNDARIGIGFCGKGAPFVLELNTADRRVQIKESENGKEFTERVKPFYEWLPDIPDDCPDYGHFPTKDLAQQCHDFSLANVEEIKNDYKLKIMLHYEQKTDSVVIDAEIGGGRTLISNRMYAKTEEISLFFENGEIKNLKICEL